MQLRRIAHLHSPAQFGSGTKTDRSEGFPRTGYLIPARGPPGVSPDGQSSLDAAAVAVAVAAVSWFHPGGYRHPGPAPCLSSKGSGHTRMVGPQQNAWSFSIPRFTGHTRMAGPSVFPDSRVIPECLVLQYREFFQNWIGLQIIYKDFSRNTESV